MTQYAENVKSAANYLRERTHCAPKIALVLGSGWNILASRVQDGIHVPYKEVPHMGVSTAPGHAGEWIFGTIAGKSVMVMCGRLHYYEGYSMQEITFPIRVMQEMGCEIVILTNAAGAVNLSYHVGDLVLIHDHINLSGQNPLFGKNEDGFGVRFPDLTKAYDRELLQIAKQVAKERSFPVREGVYAMMTGPSYETPAEIKMLRLLGADAVGMSTVPEVIAANHSKMRVLCLSCMTNMAAGVLDQPLTETEILDTLERVKIPYCFYMERLLEKL